MAGVQVDEDQLAALDHPMLWSATLMGVGFDERLAAAAAAGYASMSVSMGDLPEPGGATTPADLVARATDAGIALTVLDGLVEWYPHEVPKHALGGSSISIGAVLEAAQAFGVETVNAIGPFKTHLDTQGLAEHFAVLCDQAAEAGVQVCYEFTPRSPVADIPTVVEVLRLAGKPNAGILFDTWHFFQTNPDLDALAAVPGALILGVQVSDGSTTDYVEHLLADTFRHRLLPGDGSFDLLAALRVLRDIGGLRNVGPEVLSVELLADGAASTAQRCADAFAEVVAELRADTAA
jgi:sugar phosphate isomerase/epimerase